jgi:hypothetical protein
VRIHIPKKIERFGAPVNGFYPKRVAELIWPGALVNKKGALAGALNFK